METQIKGRKTKDIKVSYKEYQENSKRNNFEVKTFDDWKRKVTVKIEGKPDKVKFVAGESGESKNEKASRLGKVRIKKVLSGIKNLKHLSSSQYALSNDQIEKMNSLLQNAINDLKNSFLTTVKNDEEIDF